MRTDQDLLDQLKRMKIANGESYASVVKRILKKETKMPKGLTAWERENWREMN